MRPITRPLHSQTYSDYRKFREDLNAAYGPYCSYCEKYGCGHDVEHIVPRSKGGPELDWGNLLIGCTRCNRDFKKSVNNDRTGYVWPDIDETFDHFVYQDTGIISVSALCQSPIDASAHATIRLCGLDRLDSNQERANAYRLALRQRAHYDAGRIDAHDVVSAVSGRGHWSVWMTVFHDVPTVKAELSNPANFPGTRAALLGPGTP